VLKKAFENPPWGKITAKYIIASLPESKMFTRIIDLPKLGKKDVSDAIKYELEQSIPVPESDLYIDWQTIAETDEAVTVFLAAAPKSIINSYTQLFELLDMDPLALEMSLAAIARAMVSNKEQSGPVIILDIGDQASNIAIFDDNLRITGSHPIGGGTIKELLVNALGIEPKEASRKIREGISKDTKEATLIKSEVEKLYDEMSKTVQYYREKSGYEKEMKVLLCGGLGFMPGLPELLKEHGYESKIGNPWVNISIYPIKPVPKEEVPGYATAIGLCLRGMKDD
jgi:type IV pilus assembly protein PilM